MAAAAPAGAPVTATARVVPVQPVPAADPGLCPGCLGRCPARRTICLPCEAVLPPGLRAELQRTAGRPLTHQPRAQVVADALGWLRLRREGRHG